MSPPVAEQGCHPVGGRTRRPSHGVDPSNTRPTTATRQSMEFLVLCCCHGARAPLMRIPEHGAGVPPDAPHLALSRWQSLGSFTADLCL